MRGSESSGVAPGVGRPAVDISGVGSSRHLSSAEVGGELRPLEPGVGSSRHLSSAEVGGELRPLEQMPRWWGGNYVSSSAHILHPHTDLARRVWRATVRAGDVVVDATAGNGHDTLTLVHELAAAGGGTLWACDIQEAAIASAQARLRAELLSPDWQIVSGDDLHLIGDEHDAPGPDAWELHSDEAIVTVEWRVGDHGTCCAIWDRSRTPSPCGSWCSIWATSRVPTSPSSPPPKAPSRPSRTQRRRSRSAAQSRSQSTQGMRREVQVLRAHSHTKKSILAIHIHRAQVHDP